MASAEELQRATEPGGFWAYMTRRAELKDARKRYSLEHPRILWNWPDARGWIGAAVFAISVMLLWMMKDRSLREDEFFQTIVTVIISNGFLAVVAWAYAATKTGGEIANRNAAIVERTAGAANGNEGNGS